MQPQGLFRHQLSLADYQYYLIQSITFNWQHITHSKCVSKNINCEYIYMYIYIYIYNIIYIHTHVYTSTPLFSPGTTCPRLSSRDFRSTIYNCAIRYSSTVSGSGILLKYMNRDPRSIVDRWNNNKPPQI